MFLNGVEGQLGLGNVPEEDGGHLIRCFEVLENCFAEPDIVKDFLDGLYVSLPDGKQIL